MNTIHWATVVPLLLYLLASMALAFWVRKRFEKKAHTEGSKGLLLDYYAGNRSMGGFVLAMTIIASYASASSFVGGPGIAYTLGLSWVLLAMIQVPTSFLTLGILGKRFAIISRRIGGVTISDFLRARYKHDGLVLFSSIALIAFFMAAMVAQCIGGARLLQGSIGIPYEMGLAIFGISLIVYTSIGGFRAVVITDALQGIVMLIASIVLLGAVLYASGGVGEAVQGLKAIDPGLISPYGPKDAVPPPMMLSFWVLVGFGVLGLPQTTQKCMAYKDAKSMHQAMFFGTVIIGFLLLATHLSGAFGRVVMPDIEAGDLAIPLLTMELLPEGLAGIFIAGPMAAIMSTVDSMLLLISANLVKDIYLHYVHKGDISQMNEKKMRTISVSCTAVVAVLVFLAALDPPDLLVWINLFAFGGLEAVFLWPIILGLYWKRANATGALASMLFGLATYFYVTITKPDLGGILSIVPTVFVALLAFIVGSYFGKKPNEESLKTFWE